MQVLADTIDLPCRIAKGCKYCKRDDASSCLVRFGLDRYTFITINIFILFSFFFLILSWSIVRFTIQIYQILNAFHHTKKRIGMVACFIAILNCISFNRRSFTGSYCKFGIRAAILCKYYKMVGLHPLCPSLHSWSIDRII